MDYDEQQSVAKAEVKARKEREIAEAERKKTASTTPGVCSRRRDQDGKRPRAVANSDGSNRERKPRVVDMATNIGASTPFSVANATGGAKHANKSAGPIKWLQDHSSDAVADEPFYTACAHGVDLSVSIHQGVRQRDLEGGAQGVINYFVTESDSR
ncbi:unnamed protein product [Ectocarpus sp. 4 AP-2014]